MEEEKHGESVGRTEVCRETRVALNTGNTGDRAIHKTLIIAPLRVATVSWPGELEKWDHLRWLSYSVIVGTKKKRIAAINTPADIYIINRDNVKSLVEYFIDNGLRWPYDTVVIDELSSFKNYRSQRFKWLRKVRPFVTRWIGLTGTPTPNGLMDLWSEIGILDGGQRLGRFIGRFREAFFKPSSMNPQTGIVYKYVPRPGAEEQIYQRISDITISMKALDHLDMPEVVYVDQIVKMGKEERKLYDMLRNDLIIPLEDGDIDAANAASLSNKLLQMANGAVYDENKEARVIHDRKLEMLEDLIEAANGQPVLIAYWYKHDRERIMGHLEKLGYTTSREKMGGPGDLEAGESGYPSGPEVRYLSTSEDIRLWNEGKIPVALIHPASAGYGLNIQAGGHILIWFGLTWSLELYQQTNARLWRQGQKDTVTIHHIICQDTVDEDVMKALASKDVTQEKLIEAVKARLTPT